MGRLAPVVSGAPPRSAKEEALLASVLTLLLLLNAAEDVRLWQVRSRADLALISSHLTSSPPISLWQLMLEADAASAVSRIHAAAPEAPPVPLSRLLEGEHLVQRPIGRAAATFMHGLREYERVRQETHPLLSQALRAAS